MRIFIKISCLIAILCFSCKSKQNNTKSNSAISNPNAIPINIDYSKVTKANKEKWQRIIKAYYDTIISKKLNGEILIAKNGEILFEDYIGKEYIDDVNSKPINEHSALHLASCSKTFTAASILILQQDGKLNIEDLVTKYLPEFPYNNITLKMLLNHRSGLLNYVHNLENWGWKTPQLATNQDILNLIVKNNPVLNFPSDTKFSYSNTNYALLALIIEKVSGLIYGDFLKQRIFQPLQMNDTYVFQLKDTVFAIPSYEWYGKRIAFNNLDGVYGDKNIYSTARDMYKWDQSLYTNSILNDESKKLAYAPYSNEHPGVKNYGLGWRMFNFPNNKKIIFHNGWWHGNNNAFVRLIQDSATLICIGNKFSKTNYSVMQLCYLFGNYPFSYEIEEGKDSANVIKIENKKIEIIKHKLDSLTKLKSTPITKDLIKKYNDSIVILNTEEEKTKKSILFKKKK